MSFRILLLAMALSVSAFAQVPPIEPGVSQELAQWRAVRYSNVRYKLNLTLEKMSPVLKGTMEIRLQYAAEACAECPPRFIVLDWRKIRGHEEKSAISNVTLNGKAVQSASFSSFNAGPEMSPGNGGRDKSRTLNYFEHNEHLIFNDGVVMGENVIKLDFTSPILTSGSAITRYVDKEDGSEYLYSLFVPSDASTAFPVFDQPDLKARFKLELTVPYQWKAISNSSEEDYHAIHEEPAADGRPKFLRETFFFEETKPISTYVFAFAAGPFERVEDPVSRSVPPAVAGGLTRPIDNPSGGKPAFLTERSSRDSASVGGSNNSIQPPATAGGTDIGGAVYVRKSQAEKFKPHAAEVFRLNREAVRYFEEYFDYKFPFPKYDLVLIPEFPFGGMEHAGATFLREASVIFPQEPTKNDHISRATLIFHEAAHQWFGDTVTMRWFDDLWLKEGFANFAAYKALEKIMPEMNAWKVFYERIKQGAYATDSTKGTTPIYQEIKNLSAAKSAYGAIVYNKAPAFLRQAEFYLGEDKFQTAVRAFLKKHEFGNAGWEGLVTEFEFASKRELQKWGEVWVKQQGLPVFRTKRWVTRAYDDSGIHFSTKVSYLTEQSLEYTHGSYFREKINSLFIFGPTRELQKAELQKDRDFFRDIRKLDAGKVAIYPEPDFVFPNYGDYGYGIFLLDAKSREYVLKNIQNEKDPFLRSMMWGALWDSVREVELDPREYVELVVKVQIASFSSSAAGKETSLGNGERDKSRTLSDDESTTALLLNRVGTAMNYYLSEPPALAGGQSGRPTNWPAANAAGSDLNARVEEMLISGMQNSPTLGARITYYRAFLSIASSEKARGLLKDVLNLKFEIRDLKLKTKDKFDIVTRLLILNDPDGPKLLADLEKTETSDDAKRYAYAARAGIPTAENKAKYWNDFVNNKEISESWIEAAFGPWNSIRHSELTLPYLERALKELPNHKRNRKIFFVNGWLGAFIGGQRSEEALVIVNKFLADNPILDNDLRLKILENVDVIERAVRIRERGRLRPQ